METKELFHPADESDDYYICCFKLMDAEQFFRRGVLEENKNILTKLNVEKVIKFVIDHYTCENYQLNYIHISNTYFVYVHVVDNNKTSEPISLLLRVMRQIQNKLLFVLHVLACGIVTRGKKVGNFQISLMTNKIILDIESSICSFHPYIVFDDCSFATAVDELIQDRLLYKTKQGLHVANYFRINNDLFIFQPLVDYITKNHKNKPAKTAQLFIFVEMFTNACFAWETNYNLHIYQLTP